MPCSTPLATRGLAIAPVGVPVPPEFLLVIFAQVIRTVSLLTSAVARGIDPLTDVVELTLGCAADAIDDFLALSLRAGAKEQ